MFYCVHLQIYRSHPWKIYRCKAINVKILINVRKASLPQHVDHTVTHSVQLMVLCKGLPIKQIHRRDRKVAENQISSCPKRKTMTFLKKRLFDSVLGPRWCNVWFEKKQCNGSTLMLLFLCSARCVSCVFCFSLPDLTMAHLTLIQSVSVFKAGFLNLPLLECWFQAVFSCASKWTCSASLCTPWCSPGDSWLFLVNLFFFFCK